MRTILPVALFILTCILVATSTVIEAELEAPLVVEALGVQRDGERLVAVSVRNNGLKKIDALVLSGYAGSDELVLDKVRLGALAPGQVRAAELAGPIDVIYISYRQEGRRSSLFRRIDVISREPRLLDDGLQAVIIAFGGVIIGSILTHQLTSRREEASWKRRWQAERWADSTKEIMLFLREWAGNESPIALRGHMVALFGRSWIPAQLKQDLERSLRRMESGGTEKERREIAERLERRLSLFVEAPWLDRSGSSGKDISSAKP